MRRIIVAIVCVLFALSLNRNARAEDTLSAEQHDEQARAYFRTGAFVLAAAEFERAYEIEQKATRLYNAALAYEKAGDPRKASAAYGKYLSVEPSGDKAMESRARKAALDQEILKQDKEAADAAAKAEDDAKAKGFASTAATQFEEEDFAGAADSYEQAYKANKDPEYIFEQAQALRLGGKSTEAGVCYRRYILEAPGGINASEAKRQKELLERAALGEAGMSPAVSTGGGVAASPVIIRRGGRSTLATIGLVTAGVGILGLGVSAFYGVEALQLEGEIEDLDPAAGDSWSEEYNDKLEAGEDASEKSRVLGIVGGSVFVAGVVLYFVGGDDPDETTKLVHFMPTANSRGAGFALSGSF